MSLSERTLRSILHQHTPRAAARAAAMRSGDKLASVLSKWGNNVVVDISVHGSFAKDTNLVGGADIDLFISLTSKLSGTLKAMRNSLFDWLRREKRYIVRRQDVSARVSYGRTKIDIVPGKRQNQWGRDHSLWSRDLRSHIKTNVSKQINYVRSSRRQDEIRVVKIWRDQHGL